MYWVHVLRMNLHALYLYSFVDCTDVRSCWAEGSSHPRTPKIPLVTSVFCIFNVILILIFQVRILKEKCSLISPQARQQPIMCEHPTSPAVTVPTPCPSTSASVLYTGSNNLFASMDMLKQAYTRHKQTSQRTKWKRKSCHKVGRSSKHPPPMASSVRGTFHHH